MGTGNNPWAALSGMIQKKVGDARDRKQKAEDAARDNQMQIIMGGVQSHAQNGTLTDEMIQSAQEQMQKLVPKESIPVIEGWHKVMGAISRKKRQQGQDNGQPAQPAGQTAAPPQAPAAAPTAPANAPGGQSPIQPSASAPQAKPASMYPSAADMGTAAGQQGAAQEDVMRQSRKTSVDAARQWYKTQGKELPKDDERALTLWAATGHMPPASFGRSKMHPVTVYKDGKYVPGLQVEEGEDTGKVIGPDGQAIDDPEIMSKWKPRTGWAKDDQGKFYSFAIDPATNQPVKGTEDYTNLPPSQYLEKYKTGFYYWVDDSGGVHEVPHTSTSGVVSGSGAKMGKGAEATVPPGMRGPAKTTKGGAKVTSGAKTGAGAGAGTVGRTIGTKDTGILNAQAQKVITTTQPVLDQVDRLLGDIDKLNLGDNNDSGYLFGSRLKYSLGKASPEGTLASDIAGLSLGSVVEAASALQGSSRSIQALKKALVHTPNPWVDSPKLIKEKLNTIKDRLHDVVADANEYGRKRQPSTSGPASATVPPGMKSSSKQLTPDQEAEQYLSR